MVVDLKELRWLLITSICPQGIPIFTVLLELSRGNMSLVTLAGKVALHANCKTEQTCYLQWERGSG